MNTALLIIDMQNDFVQPNAPARIAGALETIPHIQKLLGYCRDSQHPVFHVVREYRSDGSDIELPRRASFLAGKKYVLPGTLGAQVVTELAPLANEYKIVKPRFSAFFGTELDLILRRLEVNRVLICGTQYPNCIRATAFDALSYGYETIVITDCTSAASKSVADANITDLVNVGVQCLTSIDYKNRVAI